MCGTKDNATQTRCDSDTVIQLVSTVSLQFILRLLVVVHHTSPRGTNETRAYLHTR